MAQRLDKSSGRDPAEDPQPPSSMTMMEEDVTEPLHKPDPELQDEIMKEYGKVKADYDRKVMNDGYDFFDPSDTPTFQKIMVPLSVLMPRAQTASDKDFANFKDSSNHIIATLPVTYMTDHPRPPTMRYFTHSNVNVIGKDEHSLSHIPYLGDGDDADIGWAEELLSVFDEGIHGENAGCGQPINDWILYHVVEPILKRHQWKDFPDIQRLMASLYKLFPNKSSAKEMAASFIDLSKRFDPAKMIAQATARDAEGSSTDADGEQDDGHMHDSENVCGPFCFQHSLKKEFKPEEQNSQLELEVPRDEDVEQLEWTSQEKSYMDLLLGGGIKSPCSITHFLSNMSSSKTCKQVFDYINGKNAAALVVCDSNGVEGSSRKLQTAYVQRQRAFSLAFRGKLEYQKPFKSCKHAGECSIGNGCYCKTQNLTCTKNCGCSTVCALRFPGCHCKPGNCRTSKCQCYFASFECDPDLCKNCNCKVNGKTNVRMCGNVSIQRRLEQKLYTAASDIAGIGCFAEEAISKGEFIGEYIGEIISQDEAERRGKIYDKFKCSYLFTLNDEQAIDATRIGNIIRFINHSKHPNCHAKIMIVDGNHHIGIYALNNIKAHDELFFDYSYNQSQVCEFVYKERTIK